MNRIQRLGNTWRNYEGSTYSYSSRTTARSGNAKVIYTIHLPSFSGTESLMDANVARGTYTNAMQYIGILQYLGVDTVHIMPLDPHVCETSETIDPSCWCRNSHWVRQRSFPNCISWDPTPEVWFIRPTLRISGRSAGSHATADP